MLALRAGFLAEGEVEEDEGGHRLDDGHGAVDHAGVVAALGFQHGGISVEVAVGWAWLMVAGGLKAIRMTTGIAVADAALDAAAVLVRCPGRRRSLRTKGSLCCEPACGCRRIRSRFRSPWWREWRAWRGRAAPPACRTPARPSRPAVPSATQVTTPPQESPASRAAVTGDHALGAVERSGQRMMVRPPPRGWAGWRIHRAGVDGAGGADPGHDVDAVGSAQPLLGDGAGGHAADGFARAGAPAAAGGAHAVLHLVGVVGVGGPGDVRHLAVVAGPLVLVRAPAGRWACPGSDPFRTREDGDPCPPGAAC
jgi:hypothetical protein